MIFGSVSVSSSTVETHRDSYRLAGISVISVRRPLLPGGVMLASGGSGFGLAFGDLLHIHEVVLLALVIAGGLLAGTRVARMQFLSRDLRGSDLACVIWGSHGRLALVRREIVAAIQTLEGGGAAS
ncbi:hypothetical protein [Albimonas pacifica]|uniref:Uncharacterized protein n=1 Tax=Albimonas pacifica TaxID=1114924 RepID=A0A1I3NZJ9_9RHOB|nr:hypothetical protein [Albimonas pacifica]SFJ14735.1 hypothetical protein SAMN05216258_1156 [Albimonas pacifica]